MISTFIHALVSIMAVMNPIGILPTFLALTANHSTTIQRQVARRAILQSFVILLVFLVLGNFILQFFGITIAAFRVAGGILLFGIAYDLLHAQLSTIQTPEQEELVQGASPSDRDDAMVINPTRDVMPVSVGPEPADISLTPLAIPVIAGPGTITTVMALAAPPHAIRGALVDLIAFTTVLLITYLIFYYSSTIKRRLRQTQINVITRLMGFILSIIAVQMAATGLLGLFPVLGRM